MHVSRKLPRQAAFGTGKHPTTSHSIITKAILSDRNCYPGARVDSRYPVYQFTDPEINKDWTWSEAFPGYAELREYLKHSVSRWDLTDNILCNANVTSAHFDEANHKWLIQCADGRVYQARWFINALGFATQPFIPKIPGLEHFQGQSFHSARWPQEGVDVKGKRVAVI